MPPTMFTKAASSESVSHSNRLTGCRFRSAPLPLQCLAFQCFPSQSNWSLRSSAHLYFESAFFCGLLAEASLHASFAPASVLANASLQQPNNLTLPLAQSPIFRQWSPPHGPYLSLRGSGRNAVMGRPWPRRGHQYNAASASTRRRVLACSGCWSAC